MFPGLQILVQQARYVDKFCVTLLRAFLSVQMADHAVHDYAKLAKLFRA